MDPKQCSFRSRLRGRISCPGTRLLAGLRASIGTRARSAVRSKRGRPCSGTNPRSTASRPHSGKAPADQMQTRLAREMLSALRIAAAIGRRLDSALRDSPRLDESSGHRRGSRACAWRRPACLVGGAPSSRGSLCPTASASLWTYSTARATSSCPGDRLERSHHLLDERPSPDVQPCPVLHGELAPGVLWPGV
jgi:hypothetical protein